MNTEHAIPQHLQAFSDQVADLVARTARLVVQVASHGRRPVPGGVWGIDRILVAGDGVDEEEDLRVHLEGGRTAKGTFSGRDPATGLALIRVADMGVQPAEFLSTPRVGQPVIALGRGWSGGLVAGFGLVSSIGGPTRMGRGPAVEQVIRTDAARYPGFDGGVMLDLSGRLVGVPAGTALRGLGVVIPASVAVRVAETLGAHGRIPRGYLGVGTQPVRVPPRQRGARTEEQGLMIVALSQGGPAERAGLLAGDILVRFDEHPVADPEELLNLLGPGSVGRTVSVEIVRGTEQRSERLVIGER